MEWFKIERWMDKIIRQRDGWLDSESTVLSKEVNKEQPSYRNLSATATRVLQRTWPFAASRKDCSPIDT